MFDFFFLCLVSVCIIKTRRYSIRFSSKAFSVPNEKILRHRLCDIRAREQKKLHPTNVAREICFLFHFSFANIEPREHPDGRNFSEFAQVEETKGRRMFRRLLWRIPFVNCSIFSSSKTKID